MGLNHAGLELVTARVRSNLLTAGQVTQKGKAGLGGYDYETGGNAGDDSWKPRS